MSTTTALQMVNRVLRKYRMDAVSAFTSPEALAILDCLNDAKDEVLDTRSWKFDEREGVINTVAYRTGVDTIALTNGSTIIFGSTTDNTEPVGSHTLRCVPSGSTDRAQTAHRVQRFDAVVGVTAVGLSENYSGDTATVAADFLVAEYQFPAHTNGDSEVRTVLSVRHQERPLRLQEIDKNFRFDRLVTRLHDSVGSDPDVVYVGRPVWSTVTNVSGDSNTLRDGCIIWPVPTSSERLDFTYRYRHPQLSDIADTLDTVPERIIAIICEFAFGFSLNTQIGNDPQKADRVLKSAGIRADRAFNSMNKTPYKSKPVRSLEDLSRTVSGGRRISNDLITG